MCIICFLYGIRECLFLIIALHKVIQKDKIGSVLLLGRLFLKDCGPWSLNLSQREKMQ